MLQVHIEDVPHGETLEQTVDKELEAFNVWFMKKMETDQPLVRSETAILKTYLWYKLQEEKREVSDTTNTVETSHGA